MHQYHTNPHTLNDIILILILILILIITIIIKAIPPQDESDASLGKIWRDEKLGEIGIGLEHPVALHVMQRMHRVRIEERNAVLRIYINAG